MVTVLLIDDDEDFTWASEILLKRASHNPLTAANGKLGLEQLCHKPSIIFVDYNMPVMNGYKFIETIRTNDIYIPYRNLPIIGIGDFPLAERELLKECIPKPIAPEAIRRCIEQYALQE